MGYILRERGSIVVNRSRTLTFISLERHISLSSERLSVADGWMWARVLLALYAGFLSSLSCFNFFSFTSNKIVDLWHKKSNKNFNLSFRTIDWRRGNWIKFNIGDVYRWWNKQSSEWTNERTAFHDWWKSDANEWTTHNKQHTNQKNFCMCVCAVRSWKSDWLVESMLM